MNSDGADTPPPVDTYGSDSDARSGSRSDSKPIVNALIGGGAGILLSFVPGSTVLGGAIAGYLEGGGAENALRVGAIAGAIMLVPILLLGLFLFGFLGFVDPGAFGVLFVALLGGFVLYTIGLSIVGALVGTALRDEL